MQRVIIYRVSFAESLPAFPCYSISQTRLVFSISEPTTLDEEEELEIKPRQNYCMRWIYGVK